MILACGVDAAPNDSGHLAPLVEEVTKTCGAPPGRVLADGSYANNAGIGVVEGQGVAVYVPVREPGQAQVEWVAEAEAYRCLAGRWLRFGGWSRGRRLYQYSGCRGCPQARACGVSGRSKRVYVWPEESPVGRVRARLATVSGATIYARRKVIIEPVIGKLKHNWGFRRLLLRGRRGANIEWTLLCLAHNLRKWAQAGGRRGAWVRLWAWREGRDPGRGQRPAATPT